MRIVIDTNVLFQGLTDPDSAAAELTDLWANQDPSVQVCVCNALELEYEDVLTRMLSPQRWQVVEPAYFTLIDLAEQVQVRYTWRPSSPDAGDEHVIDCALNARAIVVTYNTRDFRQAQEQLGLTVMTVEELLAVLERGNE